MFAYFRSTEFLATLIVMFVGVLVLIVDSMLDRKYVKKRSANEKWYKSFKKIVHFVNTVIIIILILGIFSINGIDVKNYLASLGVIGIILSFALQDLLKDVIMGISIMFEGYFKVGDIVEYEGKQGKVVSFNVKTTKLFMLDAETVMSVCNRNLDEISVCPDWIDVLIPIGYDADLYFARSICRECTKRIERLRYVYSCDFLNTQDFEESWVSYKLRIHCLAEKKFSVYRNANAVIQDVFYEHKLEFPLSIKVIYNVDPDEKQSQSVVLNEREDGVSVYDTKYSMRRKDYELGRGAAKSKECVIDGKDDEKITAAVNEAERYAISENLDQDMRLRLRLLSEELLSLVRYIPSDKEGSFYIEREGGDYEINYEIDARIDKNLRDGLIEISSKRKNEAYAGVSGMIYRAIHSMVLMTYNDLQGKKEENIDISDDYIGGTTDDYKWSYNVYREKELYAMGVDEKNAIEASRIGKSVLTRLADDIKVSVKINYIRVRILVKNDDED